MRQDIKSIPGMAPGNGIQESSINFWPHSPTFDMLQSYQSLTASESRTPPSDPYFT